MSSFPSRGVVTTAWNAGGGVDVRVPSVAKLFGFRAVKRNERSITQIMEGENVRFVVVVARDIKVHSADAPTTPVFFHPSMAAQRLLRLERGERDRLLKVAGVREGDNVLDCTLGLGSDSLVFSEVTGEKGRVTALESSFILERLFRVNQVFIPKKYDNLGTIMGRIETVNTDALSYLREQAANSFDVVYFDPMFETPGEDSANIEPLRFFADHQTLTEEMFHEASRVTRRTVVVKERRWSSVFEMLPLTPDAPGRPFVYGVWYKS